MSAEQRSELERIARSTMRPHREVTQAKALLWAGERVANEEIARRCGTTPNTVRRWRRRFEELGVAGVGRIAAGRGRKPKVAPAAVEAIVADTLHTVPDDGSTQWTTRSMAARHGVGKDFVADVWAARQIRPWRVDTFKLSADPAFEAKLVDIVGLYADKDWLAHPKRARWHLHFTPTSSSWLNLVERWFAEITNKRIRRGVFSSVRDLTNAIDHWVEHWNDNPRPFIWHRTAQEIITKVRRGRATLNHVTESATDD